MAPATDLDVHMISVLLCVWIRFAMRLYLQAFYVCRAMQVLYILSFLIVSFFRLNIAWFFYVTEIAINKYIHV